MSKPPVSSSVTPVLTSALADALGPSSLNSMFRPLVLVALWLSPSRSVTVCTTLMAAAVLRNTLSSCAATLLPSTPCSSAAYWVTVTLPLPSISTLNALVPVLVLPPVHPS
ncbi:hypothetical protein D3C80_1632360 [compost metagenome]